MSQFRFVVTDKEEENMWELPVKSGSIEWTANSVHVGALYIDHVLLKDYFASYNTTATHVFEGGIRKLFVRRRSNNSLVFGGLLSKVEYPKTRESFTTQLSFKSWLAYFERRFFSGGFTNLDQGEIAWGVLSAVNDIGLVKGIVTYSKSRNRMYEDDNVMKIVTGLSSEKIQHGYEFDISNEKVFSASSQLGNVRENVIFTSPYSVVNYTLTVPLLDGVINKGIIRGEKQGDTQIRRTYEAESQHSEAWYPLETLTNDIDVADTDVLDDKIRIIVERDKIPRRYISFDAATDNPNVEEYSVGDYVRIRLPELDMDEFRRIWKKTLYFGDEQRVSLRFYE